MGMVIFIQPCIYLENNDYILYSKANQINISEAGVSFSEKFPHLVDLYNQPLQKIDYDVLADYDVVYTSTPSGVSSSLFPPLLGRGPKLIDLSGDFRLKDLASYEAWYKKTAAPKEAVEKSVYGLTEWNEEAGKTV